MPSRFAGTFTDLGAHGFALNALVLWKAQYLDDAITDLRATGHHVTDEDLQRLSPLQHEHVKMLGHFPFTLPHDLGAGARRQLRELAKRLSVRSCSITTGRPGGGARR